MFGRHRTPSVRPSLLMFHIERPLAWISSSVVLYHAPSQWFFHFGEEIVKAWTQKKTTTLGGTEPHHSSWQCKESHCCCHEPLAPLAMGDSGTSTVLTRYESMRLRSHRQNEGTTARNPVKHKRWTYPCYMTINTEHQQRWMCWWCMMSSKHLTKGDKCIEGT